MTAARLEELAVKCAVAIDGVGRNASYGLSEDDLSDLARCARAWAKVEAMRRRGRWQLGYVCGCATLASGYSGGYKTAIEAVEAAEVKLLDMSLGGYSWHDTALRNEAEAMLLDAGEHSRFESMLEAAQRLREGE